MSPLATNTTVRDLDTGRFMVIREYLSRTEQMMPLPTPLPCMQLGAVPGTGAETCQLAGDDNALFTTLLVATVCALGPRTPT